MKYLNHDFVGNNREKYGWLKCNKCNVLSYWYPPPNKYGGDEKVYFNGDLWVALISCDEIIIKGILE